MKTDSRGFVHHSRCGNPERDGCRCPTSWPRKPEHVGLTHRRSGNCWAGVTVGDACTLHDEPRGECSVCARCIACDTASAPGYLTPPAREPAP